MAVARDWRNDLVVDYGDLIFLDDQLLPSQFSAEDAKPRWHEKGPVVWIVGDDGEVTVWMAVERRRRFLFTALTEHLPSLAMKHQELTDKIVTGIKAVVKTPEVTRYIREIPNIGFGLANELESTLKTRVFTGSCHICGRIDDSANQQTTDHQDLG